jgi:cyclophilin family peptidyl-prolyl cis-trans isomerase
MLILFPGAIRILRRDITPRQTNSTINRPDGLAAPSFVPEYGEGTRTASANTVTNSTINRPDGLAAPSFRSSTTLSVVNYGPHTAGSQFFITLAPKHDKDGTCTVFGRALKGQDVIERITRRQTTSVRSLGPTIPGDLLVRAGALRQPPEYRVIKAPPK